MYKLTEKGVIKEGIFIPEDEKNRHWQEYLFWLTEGNTPLEADNPTPEQLAKEEEVRQAPLTARQYFLNKQAAINFIKKTPEEQGLAIDIMTTPQLKEVVKYLAVAVSALIKEKYLN